VEFLEEHPKVEKVIYPFQVSHPQQKIARQQMKNGGGMISFILKQGREAAIIRLGTRLGVPYAITQSCYDPVGGKACGRCDSCILRRRGFEEAGVPDPTRYVSRAAVSPRAQERTRKP
jgi:7-cyano-7-deazaguanine synthase in queuosine biosynthesis